MNRSIAGLVVIVFAAAGVRAQGTRTVPVSVTAVSGRSIYLDKGRADGLAPGTIVRLFPAGVGPLELEVRSVSSSSARAELRPGQTEPPVGARGEAEVAAGSRDAEKAPKTSRARPVDHPPWTRTEDERSPGQPLLVPTFRQRPDERPLDVHGRLFGQGDWSHNSTGEASSDYLLGRVGTRLEGSNVLGQGERVRFAGELSTRQATLSDGPDTHDEVGRIDQLAVAFGTEDWSPYGVEVGRFLSEHLPELGLIDGVEGVARFAGGLRAGGGLASYPRPFPARDTGEDMGAHVFVDYLADADRSLGAGVGFQKTWHDGAPDRDLFLLRVEARPGGGVSLFSTAKVDIYSSSDARKASGLELTEFLGQARLDGERAGIGLQASRFRWPDLKRREYQDLPDVLVRDGRLDRLSLTGWVRPMKSLRLNARADAWRDQARDGTSLEVGGDWFDLLGTDNSLHVALFRSDGSYNSGPGARLRLSRRIGDADVSLGYRWHRYDVEGLLAGDETFTRQSLSLGADWSAGGLDWSLTAERWFGDREDAYAVSLFTQLRF